MPVYINIPNTKPEYRPKWSKSITFFRPKPHKTHALEAYTYLYSPQKGVPPPERSQQGNKLMILSLVN